MVFNHKPTALMLTRKQFQYQRKSNIISEPDTLQGEIIETGTQSPVINNQNKAVKLIRIRLKNAKLTDGTSFSGKNWLVLSPRKGLIFETGAKTPDKGRIVFFLRSSSKPESGFRFKYTLTGDGKDIPLSQWKRFPNRILMKGKGWTLTCGYLITPVLPLKKLKQFILSSSRSQSHIIKVGILPEEN